MVQGLRKVTHLVLKVFLLLGTVCLIVLAADVFIQVLSRYVFNTSLAWTEELSRFAFMYSTMFAVPVVLDRGGLAAITAIPNLIKGMPRKAYDFIVMVLVLICSIIITVYGFQLSSASGWMFTTALHAPMWVQYAPVPIGGCGLVLVAVTLLLEMIWPPKKSEPAEEIIL